PRELDEAAMMDGCSPWRIYWKIMLPLSVPALVTTAIFTFIWTWDDFFAPLIYLNRMQNYTVMLGLRTFVDSTAQSDYGGLFAMSVLSIIPIFLFFLIFQRLLIEGIATTGMKRCSFRGIGGIAAGPASTPRISFNDHPICRHRHQPCPYHRPGCVPQ